VAALAAAGRSVLLTSYTNSAVDNVLLKLRAAGMTSQEIIVIFATYVEKN